MACKWLTAGISHLQVLRNWHLNNFNLQIDILQMPIPPVYFSLCAIHYECEAFIAFAFIMPFNEKGRSCMAIDVAEHVIENNFFVLGIGEYAIGTNIYLCFYMELEGFFN